MSVTVADLLVDRFIAWGVDTIFGFPGDGIDGLFEALRTRHKHVAFIQVRHEEAAAFAACGYAKYRGDGGFTMLTGEIAALVKHDLRVKVIIIKNNVLGEIKWEQMVLEGNPEYGVDMRRLGAWRNAAPIYGSGGFTSYTNEELCAQLTMWVEQGIPRVKMKIGRDAAADVVRVAAARRAIGDSAEREHGYEPGALKEMLRAGAADVLQAHATRCEGITGLLVVDELCDAMATPLSTHLHCAPSLHAHPACAMKRLRHVEYFHDHARIEHLLFDGALRPRDGALYPDLERPRLGLELKRSDARKYGST